MFLGVCGEKAPGWHARVGVGRSGGAGTQGAGGNMIEPTFVDAVAPLLTVLTPLVAVPLTVITFYLRSLREQQVSWHRELSQRVAVVERALTEARKAVDDFERDYTTKEEWLRECMFARRAIEDSRKTSLRLELAIQRGSRGPRKADAGPATSPTRRSRAAAKPGGERHG